MTEYGIDGMIEGGAARLAELRRRTGICRAASAAGATWNASPGARGLPVFTLGHNNPWQSYDIAGAVANAVAGAPERGVGEIVGLAPGCRLRPSTPTPAPAATKPRRHRPCAHPAAGRSLKSSSYPPNQTVRQEDNRDRESNAAPRLTRWFDDPNLSVQAASSAQPGDTVYG